MRALPCVCSRALQVKLLLVWKADLTLKDVNGALPKHVADRKGHTEIVELLEAHAASPLGWQQQAAEPAAAADGALPELFVKQGVGGPAGGGERPKPPRRAAIGGGTGGVGSSPRLALSPAGTPRNAGNGTAAAAPNKVTPQTTPQTTPRVVAATPQVAAAGADSRHSGSGSRPLSPVATADGTAPPRAASPPAPTADG